MKKNTRSSGIWMSLNNFIKWYLFFANEKKKKR